MRNEVREECFDFITGDELEEQPANVNFDGEVEVGRVFLDITGAFEVRAPGQGDDVWASPGRICGALNAGEGLEAL